jgi:hypothetical protein
MRLNGNMLPTRGDRCGVALCALLVPALLLWSLCIDVVIVHSHADEPSHVHTRRTLGFHQQSLRHEIDHCHDHHHGHADPSPADSRQGDEPVFAAEGCHTRVHAASSDGLIRPDQRAARQLLDLLSAALMFAHAVAPHPLVSSDSPALHVCDSPPPALDVVRCAVRLI